MPLQQAIHFCSRRLLGLALGAALGVSVATAASAAAPVVRREGDFCPLAGCAGPRGSALGQAAGFAAASLAAAALARRRGAVPR